MSDGEVCFDTFSGAIFYNPSKLLEYFNTMPEKWRTRLDHFTRALDEKVTINKDNPEYSPIVMGMVEIIDRICEELLKIDSESYSGIQRISTGSQHSRSKVGLPHEADFLLKLGSKILNRIPDEDSCQNFIRKFSQDIIKITNKKDVTNGNNNWIIHGAHEHGRVPGVCIVMEYRAHGKPAVGVTMDAIFCVSCDKTEVNDKVPENVVRYLESGNLKQHLEGDMIKLLGSNVDSGIVENRIMGQLSDDLKRGYRVVKYLLQCIHSHEIQDHVKCSFPDDSRSKHLYGYKPNTKSYILRLYLLHFLLHKGDIIEQFTGGLPAVFLLDVIYCTSKHLASIKNPLGNCGVAGHGSDQYVSHIEAAMALLMEAPIENIDKFNMLNSDSNPVMEKVEDLLRQGDGGPGYPLPNDHIRIFQIPVSEPTTPVQTIYYDEPAPHCDSCQRVQIGYHQLRTSDMRSKPLVREHIPDAHNQLKNRISYFLNSI